MAPLLLVQTLVAKVTRQEFSVKAVFKEMPGLHQEHLAHPLVAHL
jgi:uncharacterized membrane protein